MSWCKLQNKRIVYKSVPFFPPPSCINLRYTFIKLQQGRCWPISRHEFLCICTVLAQLLTGKKFQLGRALLRQNFFSFSSQIPWKKIAWVLEKQRHVHFGFTTMPVFDFLLEHKPNKKNWNSKSLIGFFLYETLFSTVSLTRNRNIWYTFPEIVNLHDSYILHFMHDSECKCQFCVAWERQS